MNKISYSIAAILFFLLPAFAQAENSSQINDGCLHTTYNAETYYEYVYGNINKLKEIKGSKGEVVDVNLRTHDNWHYSEEITTYINDHPLFDNFKFDFFFDGIHSSDKNIQPISGELWNFKDVRLRLYGMYIGKSTLDENISNYSYDVTLGSGTANFTDYSIKGNIFGIIASYRPSCLFTVMALGGTNKYLEEDSYIRPYEGGRFIFTPNPDMLFGTTFIHSEISWLDPDSSKKFYRNDVLSLDANLTLLDDRLKIDGETAVSWYNADRDDPAFDTVNGWAVKTDVTYQTLRGLNLFFNYEYQEPNFATKLGVNTRKDNAYKWESLDNEIIRGRFTYTPMDIFTLTGEYKYRKKFVDSDYDYFRNIHESVVSLNFTRIYSRINFFRNFNTTVYLTYKNDQSNDIPKSYDKEYFETKIEGKKEDYTLTYYYIYNKHEYDDRYSNEFRDSFTHKLAMDSQYYVYYMWLFKLKFKLSCSVSYTDTIFKNPDHLYTDVKLGLGTETYITFLPSDAMLSIVYVGEIPIYNEGDEQYKNETKITLSQPITINNRFKSSIDFSYENSDYWYRNEDDRCGEDMYKLSVNIEF